MEPTLPTDCLHFRQSVVEEAAMSLVGGEGVSVISQRHLVEMLGRLREQGQEGSVAAQQSDDQSNYFWKQLDRNSGSGVILRAGHQRHTI